MALLSLTGHVTGLSGRGSGTVPVPARAEEHASSSGAAPRAARVPPTVRFRKDRRVSFLGAPWPCQPSVLTAVAALANTAKFLIRRSISASLCCTEISHCSILPQGGRKTPPL